MNQELDPGKIRQLLDRSTDRLDQPALAGLRNARMQALARYDAHRSAPVLAWAGTGSGHATGSHRRHYYWAAAILLAASLFSVATYWQHAQEHNDSDVDVDIAILTDEMPVDVYVD